MVDRGVSSSWLTTPRNSARRRSTSCSAVRSCKGDDDRLDHARLGADGRGVDQGGDTPAVGYLDDDLLGPHRLARAQRLRPGGNSRSEISRPSARRKVSTSSSCSADWSGLRRLSTIFLPSRLSDTGAPVLASKTITPTGEVLISVSRSALGPLLVLVAAGVGDGHRRLGGEHQQRVLVLPG